MSIYLCENFGCICSAEAFIVVALVVVAAVGSPVLLHDLLYGDQGSFGSICVEISEYLQPSKDGP